MATLEEVLGLEPGKITDAVKARIIEHYGSMDAAEIGSKQMFALTTELQAILPSPDFDAETRLATAEELLKFLARMGFGPQAQPQTVKLVQDKTPEQMTLRELLNLLVSDPSRRAEILAVMSANAQVRNASAKTEGKWVIPNADGRGINVDETVKYVENMLLQYSMPQRMISGVRPTTIDNALGIDRRPLIHPFTGRPVHGADGEFDLTLLDPTLHEALIWAARTKHLAWPQTIDVYGFTEQVFQQPLPRRWQIILDDYVAAKKANPDSVRFISRYWPENVSLDSVIDLVRGIVMGAGEIAPGIRTRGGLADPAPDYAQLVRDAGNMAGVLVHNGSASDYNGGVYQKIAVHGSANTLNGVVCVQGGTITGSANEGNLLLPPGVRVVVTGSANRINQRNIGWKELAEHLGLI